jgi:peptidylprolyl isomerase
MKFIVLAAFCASLAAAAHAAPPVAAPAPAPAPPSEADWRTPDPQNVLVIDTNKGRIIVEMNPAVAPLTVKRLRDLTRQGFYNGRAFFRVIDNFMDQTGDPKDNGTGGSTLPNLAPEFTFRHGSDAPMAVVNRAGAFDVGFMGALPVISQTMDLALLTVDNRVNAWGGFCPGVGGMARAQEPDSGNSQFFLMRGTAPALNQKYTAWGRVISGMDVVRAIKTGEPPPPPADQMQTVRVLADIPAAQRPSVRVIDTQGAWFKAMTASALAQKPDTFNICDLDLPAQVK